MAGRTSVSAWYMRLGVSSALFLAIVLSLIVIAAVLVATRTIVVPLILSLAIAIGITPFVNRIEAWGLNRSLAAFIGLLLFIGVFVGALFIVGLAVADQKDELRGHFDDAQAEVEDVVADLPIDVDTVGKIRDSAENAVPAVRDGALTGLAGALDTAIAIVIGVVLGLIFLYYLLKDGALLAGKGLDLFGEENREAVDEIGAATVAATRNYFGSRTVMAALNAVAISLGMLVLGVPAVLAIGVVNFVGGYVPYLGAFVGGAFAVILAISEGGIGLGLAALAVVLVVQLVLENLVEPRVVGEFVDLHPLVVLAVTILGGMFGGIVGLILAVPTTIVIIESIGILRRHGYFEDSAAEGSGDGG
jgi:predicted PurR-regulated permease PerM